MKTIPGLLIIALLFGISTAFAEVKDYSSTINTFKDSPAVSKFFKNSYGYAVFPTIGRPAMLSADPTVKARSIGEAKRRGRQG
jgi:hypothetical protein